MYVKKGYKLKDCIRLTGLQFAAKHGVLPEEHTLYQPFEVDVEIHRDLTLAAVSDKLDDTVNYSALVDIVDRVVNGKHCDLIEHLAWNILESIAGIVYDGEVTVRVRKPKAPLKLPFQTVEVELKRTLPL